MHGTTKVARLVMANEQEMDQQMHHFEIEVPSVLLPTLDDDVSCLIEYKSAS